MSRYTPTVEIGPITFDGDDVTFIISRLDVLDFETLQPFMVKKEDGSINVGFENGMSLIKAAANILPKHIEKIKGLYVNGIEVDEVQFSTQLITKMYFIDLVSELLISIFNESMLSEDEEKNLDELRDDTLRASSSDLLL